MPYTTRPLTTKELSKTILIGAAKGLAYYIIYYVVLFRLVIYYIIPYLVSATELKGLDVSSIISLELFNENIILILIALSIIGTFLIRHIPYGRALDSLIGLLILYIILSTFNFGKFEGHIAEYNTYYYVDLSPLFRSILQIIVFFTLGRIFVSVGKEYRSRNIKR